MNFSPFFLARTWELFPSISQKTIILKHFLGSLFFHNGLFKTLKTIEKQKFSNPIFISLLICGAKTENSISDSFLCSLIRPLPQSPRVFNGNQSLRNKFFAPRFNSAKYPRRNFFISRFNAYSCRNP